MARETKQNIINRQQQDIEKLREQLNVAFSKINELQQNADNAFANSPHCKQLEQEILTLQEMNKVDKKLLENAEKRCRQKDEIIHQLKNERPVNERGAGRKPKFTETEIQEIINKRNEGATLNSLANEYTCSVGLIHKILHGNATGKDEPNNLKGQMRIESFCK